MAEEERSVGRLSWRSNSVYFRWSFVNFGEEVSEVIRGLEIGRRLFIFWLGYVGCFV